MQTRKITGSLLLIAMTTISSFAQKEAPPEGSRPKDFVLPSTIKFTLENGLRVTLIPYGSLPKVNIRAVVRAGNLNEAADQVWLADLTGDFLEEGTLTRPSLRVAEEAASMGGEISIGVTEDETTISGSVLSEFGPDMTALIADVIRNPAFPESEMVRLRNDRIRDLNIQRSEPATLANERFRALMYPDHPYGRLYPSEELLASYTMEDVRNFYTANFGAARTRVYVAGRFDSDAMEKAVRRAFTTWERGANPLIDIPEARSEKSVHIIDRPGAQQSNVYLGLPTIDPSHEDYRKFQVMNTLLGGSFMSRITSNIREDKGYTYSPRSSVSSRYRDSYWNQYAAITTNVTGAALKEIFHEIDRLRSEPPTAEELLGFQNYLAGLFVLRNSSPEGIIGLLAFNDLHGLPETYLTEYVRTVYSVTPEDVQQLAGKYLDREKIQIVIAGDAKVIAKQVAPFGPVIN